MTENLALLDVLQIDATTELLPQDKLDAVTEMRARFIPEPARLFSFLARCPNVTTLFCGDVPKDALPSQVDDNVLPILEKCTGPLHVAKLLVTGRPLKEIEATATFGPAAPSLITEVIPFLAAGTGTIRSLQLGTFRWSDGCVEAIAALFPQLEALQLDIHILWDPKNWLQDHLLDVVDRLEQLHQIILWCGPGRGPPSEERLEEQLLVLQEARTHQRLLSSVSFQRDLTWDTDLEGRWTATYSGYMGRQMVLLSPLDYLPAKEALGYHQRLSPPLDVGGYHGPTLPTELLIQIFTSLRLASTSGTPLIPNLVFATVPSTEQIALKNISLANEAFRSIAQPIVFDHIDLSGTSSECLVRARKILKMVEAREESTGWIKCLHLNWLPRRNFLPDDSETANHPAQLVDIVSQLFIRLTQVTTFQAEVVTLTPKIYSRLYCLPSLRALRLIHISLDETGLDLPPLDGLEIDDLHVDNGDQNPAMLIAIMRFARSPRLRKLTTGALAPSILGALLGTPPRPLANVTDVCIASPTPTLAQILDLVSACPNTRSITISVVPSSTQLTERLPLIPQTVVPLLNRIEGPLDVVRAFTPGRPVETIEVLGPIHFAYEWSKETLAPLAAGSVPVRELTLQAMSWRDDATDIIYDLFPSVELLKVHFVGERQSYLEAHLLDEVRRFKNLRVLHLRIDKSGYNFATRLQVPEAVEAKEREALDAALELGSSLVEVAFEAGKSWRLKDGKVWERNQPVRGPTPLFAGPMRWA